MDLLDTLIRADERITQIHKAFGAPGDWGYEHPQGQALYGLYKFREELRAEIAAAEARAVCTGTVEIPPADSRLARFYRAAGEAVASAIDRLLRLFEGEARQVARRGGDKADPPPYSDRNEPCNDDDVVRLKHRAHEKAGRESADE